MASSGLWKRFWSFFTVFADAGCCGIGPARNPFVMMFKRIQRGMGWLLGATLLAGVMARAASVEIPVAAPPASRLQTLERKAKESDRYRVQCHDLQKTLDDMLALIPGEDVLGEVSAYEGFGQLSKLLEKAAMADLMTREMQELRDEFEQVVKQRNALLIEVETLKSERDKAVADRLQEIENAKDRVDKMAALRETIERLLLGEFEYYEVKDGDSLQSIAANPLIYGDPARAAWLRQANSGRVKHLDHLRRGEMLVIPRFPRTGSYEF